MHSLSFIIWLIPQFFEQCLAEALIEIGKAVDCPSKTGKHIVIPNTVYSVIQDPNDRSVDRVDRPGAAELCNKCGLSLAKVPNMVTLALIGRNYEPIVTKYSIMDTWYWLDNSYNPNLDKYVYGNSEDGTNVMNYSLFYYRPPRPTGLGAHLNYKQQYVPEQNVPQCLSLSLPFPHWKRQKKENSIYGHHTVFEERACESVQARHAMCQSSGDKYQQTKIGKRFKAFTLTEDKLETYFYDGNWILGNRKYIMNYKHRTAKETRSYCESIGLQVFEPDSSVMHLIPHVKIFSRGITAIQFWTSLIYDTVKKEFYDSTGKKIDIKEKVEMKFDGKRRRKRDAETMEGQTNKKDHLFCVAMMLAYEFSSQMPCNDVLNPKCLWNFIRFVPANCNNYHATLCQHSDKDARAIKWDPEYFKNVDQALIDTATKPFGYDSNPKAMRSTYKQTFGSLICPEGFRMLRSNNSDWYTKPKEEKYFVYDYKETYWVVDGDAFEKDIDSKCTVSAPNSEDGFTRELKSVPCDEWHFYLCARLKRPGKKPTKDIDVRRLKNKWDVGELPRIYPIVRGKDTTLDEEYTTRYPLPKDWLE